MINVKDIFNILDQQSRPVLYEKVLLKEAVGRLLVKPVQSPMDSPPFDKSAMDGWAIRKDEKSTILRSIATVAAGDASTVIIEPGTCAAIMTGAKVPEGTGRVIRIEYSHREGDSVVIDKDDPLINIIGRGENIRKGDPALTPRILSAGDMGILASMGIAQVEVAIAPSIGIVTTGTELKDPGEELKDGEIYNSNGPQLMAQADIWGCPVHYYGIVADDREALRNTVHQALRENDIVLLSGGVSMGEFDYVPGILEEEGVTKIFHKAAIKPGRPLWFGKNENTFVFGLPGNPVSTFILFEVFVKYLIQKLCGLNYEPAFLRGVLGESITRKTWDRTEFLPVKWVDEEVVPVRYHGSSHLNAMAEAKGLIVVEAGIEKVEKGETVHVRLL
ncbi:MAG: molybdopterin molybdotransferase MoeA [Spirochaetaceae bacterium]|nr:molybdopterin molybdotransferase MoeA [Spirochaetaceae bacterium]